MEQPRRASLAANPGHHRLLTFGSAALLAVCLACLLAAREASAARQTAASLNEIGALRAVAASRRTSEGANARSGDDSSSSSSSGLSESEKAQLAARVAALRARPLEYTDDALEDLVPHLPGWGAVNDFNLFAGYITVDDDAGRALFYAFAEATSDDPSASEGEQTPLVMWLNGGPGCSSIGGGFMSELGPFYPLPGGSTLQANPYPWNSFAHVLFLESPAYVGFSYSNTTEDAIVGDERTAADSRTFLIRFLDRFPRFRNTPFYVAGESYAGHYVPNLALAIVDGNRAAPTTGDPKINIQGFLVGNPWTDAAIDNLGAVDYWWSHALISDQTALGIRTNCNFSRIGPLDPHPAHPDAETRDELCDDFCNKAFLELGNINIYEIYADMCSEPPGLRNQVAALSWALGSSSFSTAVAGGGDSSISSSSGSSDNSRVTRRSMLAASAAAMTAAASKAAGQHGHGRPDRKKGEGEEGLSYKAARMMTSSSAVSSLPRDGLSASGDGADPGYDPCVDDEVETYLNLPEVQRALHANQTVKLPWRWTDCTRSIMYSREDLLASMLPVYQRLLQTDLRMLIYSGDVDGIVPVVGTRRWVASLRLKERAPWRPWSTDGQVGGYIMEYEGLTFATVRGAGHMVPYVQPARGAHLARAFLEGRPL